MAAILSGAQFVTSAHHNCGVSGKLSRAHSLYLFIRFIDGLVQERRNSGALVMCSISPRNKESHQ